MKEEKIAMFHPFDEVACTAPAAQHTVLYLLGQIVFNGT